MPKENSEEESLSPVDVEVISLLASRAVRTAPTLSEELRRRILSTARAERFAFIRESAGIWIDVPTGGSMKELFHDSNDRAATRLLKLPVGKSTPAQSIVGSRALFVVRGSISSRATHLDTGDCVIDDSKSGPWTAETESVLLEFSSIGSTAGAIASSAAADWRELFPGARIRSLAGGRDAPETLFILDMIAHSSLGEHDHAGLEELFVLAGSCTVEGEQMSTGDYHRASSGTHHQATATEEGCMLLVSMRDLQRLAA